MFQIFIESHHLIYTYKIIKRFILIIKAKANCSFFNIVIYLNTITLGYLFLKNQNRKKIILLAIKTT